MLGRLSVITRLFFHNYSIRDLLYRARKNFDSAFIDENTVRVAISWLLHLVPVPPRGTIYSVYLYFPLYIVSVLPSTTIYCHIHRTIYTSTLYLVLSKFNLYVCTLYPVCILHTHYIQYLYILLYIAYTIYCTALYSPPLYVVPLYIVFVLCYYTIYIPTVYSTPYLLRHYM